ncbi:hypothetical protein B0H19DRAFT_1070846 [Mycena capillaripes]|nr:hypothetical protein B0H19DRAFT_1070846 [Mycena capillaripes]
MNGRLRVNEVNDDGGFNTHRIMTVFRLRAAHHDAACPGPEREIKTQFRDVDPLHARPALHSVTENVPLTKVTKVAAEYDNQCVQDEEHSASYVMWSEANILIHAALQFGETLGLEYILESRGALWGNKIFRVSVDPEGFGRPSAASRSTPRNAKNGLIESLNLARELKRSWVNEL